MQSEKNLKTAIDLICMRPEMYVGSRNVELVIAFIEGFAYASSENELRQFEKWLIKKFNLPKNWVWSYGRRVKIKNEEEILKQLPLLFSEFINCKVDETNL
jgi:hypothetical protein